MLVVFYKNIPEMGQEIIQMNGGRIWGGGAFVCLYVVCVYMFACLYKYISVHIYTRFMNW